MDHQTKLHSACVDENLAEEQALESLPASICELLEHRGERVSLPSLKLLARAREQPRYGHFLVSGAAALVTVLQDGRAIQAGLLGRGCLVETYQLLGAAQVFTEVVMELGGSAYRVPFRELQETFRHSEAMRLFLLGQMQNHTLVAHQLAACNYYHELEPRLASLLLLLQEHARSPRFYITQESLAFLLGVRRTTLTLSAGKLQHKGLVRYTRGHLEISDPEQLAAMACECYGVIRTINSHCRLM